jgi:aminoglycoside phosphotransferase (APT) family kinase protein
LATCESVIDDRVIAAGDRFRHAIPQLHARMAEGAQALAHGDFRLDNFMFGTEPRHRPFVMLDFQAPIVTKPVHDVAYLITQSMITEDRRRHEWSLLDDYHAALVDGGIQGYTRQQCEDDYRLAALHCFEYAVVVAGTLYPSNDRGSRWITQMIGRSAQTIVDLDLLDLLD